jgi:hypothetical protein
MRCCLMALVLLSSASAKDPPVYPLHGTVTAMRTDRVTIGAPVYTGANGKTYGGGAHSRRVPVFKIQTDEMNYEVEGGKDLTIGEDLSFRVDKRTVYIQRGDKEQKCRLVGQEKRQSPP